MCNESHLEISWSIDTTYKTGSKLKGTTIYFSGILKQPKGRILRGLLNGVPFTMVSFCLLGISFLFAGLIPLLGKDVNPWITRIGLLTFECAAPSAALVSSVVKYVLWPTALARSQSNTALLKNKRTLIKHNGK